MSNKTIRIYGAGGTGTNIAKFYQDKNELIKPAYLDTSDSNILAENAPLAYLVEGLRGSGKKRRLNVEAIRKHIGPALNQFVPGDFNLVVFSASGGSGSVFGPLVLEELINRGKLAVGIVLGDVDSEVAAANTLETLQNLSKLSEKHATSVSLVYQEMADGSQRRAIDNTFHDAIGYLVTLAGLVGRPGSELDEMDLTNWLHYERASTHRPGLGLLNILCSNDRLAEQSDALSVASVYASPDNEHGPVKAAYRTTGYSFNETTHPIHYVITQNGLHAMAEAYGRRLADYQKQKDLLAAQHVKLHNASEPDLLF